MEVKKKKPKFLRRTWSRYSKLGKQRKKKQIWKAPKGRDNKMREKRKGYPAVVSIGYKKPQKEQAVCCFTALLHCVHLAKVCFFRES